MRFEILFSKFLDHLKYENSRFDLRNKVLHQNREYKQCFQYIKRNILASTANTLRNLKSWREK